MKKIFNFSILTLAILSSLCSCRFVKINHLLTNQLNGEGEMVTRTIDVPEFTGILCYMPAKIEYRQSDSTSLEISAQENILEYTQHFVDKDGRLQITRNGKNMGRMETMIIRLSSPSLKKVELGGAGEFNAPEGITAEELEIENAGATSVNIVGLHARKLDLECAGAGSFDVSKIDCEDVEVEIAGACSATLAGKAKTVSVEISGVGTVDIRNLEREKLKTEKNGLARIRQ